MIYLYCITFPNCKKYVGITKNVKLRMHHHKYAKSVIGSAFRKFKIANVKIMGYYKNYEDAYKAEIELIKELESTVKDFGYNVSKGGQGPSVYKAWNRGIPQKEEVKSKISKSCGSKTVIVYKDGQVVGTWTNLNKCSSDLKVHRGNISHCLSGRLKKTGGYKFEVFNG